MLAASRALAAAVQLTPIPYAAEQIAVLSAASSTLATLDSPTRGNWELDSEFFIALSHWTHEHPSWLDLLLDELGSADFSGDRLLPLIADLSFPARGLIGDLSQLLVLGIRVARTTRVVRGLAHDVMSWVGNLKDSFESSGAVKDGFTRTMWKYLRNVGILIHEICRWAAARVRDNRWSRIGNGLRSASEIVAFRICITTARGFLSDFGKANFLRRSFKTDLSIMLHRQSAITREIEKIVKIQSEQSFTGYVDELLAQVEALQRLQTTMKTLSSHTVTNNTYHQQGKHLCIEGTRTDILRDIKQWIHDVSIGSPNFLWLTGSPGCGKSTIAASIAQICDDEETLWAQLFISRNNINTVNPDFYFPSIARQLAARSETVEGQIHEALKEKTSLLDRVSVTQAMQLFVNTIGTASKLDPQKPVVVVIDGLDETEEGRLAEIAAIFSQLFGALFAYPNVKVLISCRPIDDIQKPFVSSMTRNGQNVRHIHIDTNDASSVLDVSVYIKNRMAQIAAKYDLPSSWPGKEAIDTFTARASGLFVLAVTALRFIDDQIGHSGKERLDSIFDALDSKIGIVALYNMILHSAYSHETDDSSLESFRRIVGAIAVLQKPLSLSELSGLLSLEQYGQNESNKMQELVARLRTILVPGTDAIDMQTVPVLHKSFFEFITSDRVDPRFRIDANLSHRDLAVQCLRLLSGAYVHLGTNRGEHTQSISTSLSGSFRYAFQFWSSHLELSHPYRERSTGVAVGNIDIATFHNVLRFATTGGLFGPLRMSLSPDGSQIQISLEDRCLAWDVATGHRADKICHLGPFVGHEKPLSSVAYSSGGLVASGSWDNTIIIWNAPTGYPIGAPIVGHTKTVWSVAFSPDGKQLVSGSWDRTVRLWDVQTGMPICSPFIGHTNLVSSVAFSPNGKQVVSGSWDHTIRLWDLQTGQPIGTPFKGHSDWVWSVAYSPDGHRIVSASHDKTIRIWDAYSGQCIGLPFKGHEQSVTAVAFSPDGRQVVSGSEDRTIRIWDPDTGRPVGTQPLLCLNKRIWSVAFSPSGRHIAVGCEDGTVYLSDADKTMSVPAKLTGHTGPVYSVAFGAGGTSIASSSGDHTVRVWEVPITPLGDRASTAFSPQGEKAATISSKASSEDTLRIWDWEASKENDIGQQLEGGLGSISCVAFSSSGACLAATTRNGAVYLWDAAATTVRLIASSSTKDSSPTYPTSPPISLAFSADDKRVIVKFADGRATTLRVEAEKLIEEAEGDPSAVQHELAFFDIDERPQWVHEGVQWFPSRKRDPSSGLWACINNCVIRGRADGSITVVEFSLR